MNADTEHQHGLIVSLLALAAREESLRVSKLEFNGDIYWIKRFDRDDRRFIKSVHRFFSVWALPQFFRASPQVNAQDAATRELRKSAAFASAGFPVTEVLYKGKVRAITRHVGKTIYAQLASVSEHERQSLMIRSAMALANAHMAGLCHGRPHIRDMFTRDDKIGFMDFEEEPEAVMPLAMAQARDAWLFFSFATDIPENQTDTLEAYLRLAPIQTILELDKLVTVWHRLLTPLRKALLFKPGSDLRRLLKADVLLYGKCAAH